MKTLTHINPENNCREIWSTDEAGEDFVTLLHSFPLIPICAATGLQKFAQLAAAGKSVALDLNIKTGEQAARYSKNIDGVEGHSIPGIPYSTDWKRILVCVKGCINVASDEG